MCLAALGPMLYFMFLHASGMPLPSEAYALHWKTVVDWPWNTVGDTLGLIFSKGDRAVTVNFALFGVTILVAMARKQRPEYLVYTLALLLLVLSKRSESSQQQWARYALLAFPVGAQAASFLRDKAIFAAAVLALILVNLYLMRSFLEWSMVV